MTNFKIIDCTFRDGGYYTDWKFAKPLVEDTLAVLSALPVEYVEIGFRNLTHTQKHGDLYYTTEDHINSLKIPSGTKLAVMMMLNQFENCSDQEIVASLIAKKDSRIELIRVGVYLSDIDYGLRICAMIQDLGYKVSLNLIRINNYSRLELETYLGALRGKSLDIVCLADTLGNMTPRSLTHIIESTRSIYSGSLGFHAHNNRGFAMHNTLVAIDQGVEWVDATVSGMGRGAGNLALEGFLLEYQDRCKVSLDLAPIFDLCEREFWPLKEKCHWGYNPYYHLAAILKIHPTHVQSVLAQHSSDPAKEKIKHIVNPIN